MIIIKKCVYKKPNNLASPQNLQRKLKLRNFFYRKSHYLSPGFLINRFLISGAKEIPGRNLQFSSRKSLKIRAGKFSRFLDERNRNISHTLTPIGVLFIKNTFEKTLSI